MATLQAHGRTVKDYQFASQILRVMSDGTVLRNYGSGWKLYLRSKLSPAAICATLQARYDLVSEKHAAFRAAMTRYPISLRSRLYSAIVAYNANEEMAFSILNGDYEHKGKVSITTLHELCALYLDWQNEKR